MTAIASRPRAISRGVVALAATLGFMIGVPWALIHFVGNPLPTVIPSIADIRFAITHGQIAPQTFIKIIAFVTWLAWAHLAASFLVEIAATIRGGTARAVQGLGATQWLAAKVVSNVTLSTTLLFQSTMGIASAAPPLPTALPSQVAMAATPVADTGSLVAAPGYGTQPFQSGAEGSTLLFSSGTLVAETEEAPVTGAEVEVGRRDTLWGLAQTHLGDGERWEEIRDANVGRIMDDGTRLAEGFTQLEAGWVLVIPGAANTTTSVTSEESTELDTGHDTAPRNGIEPGHDTATGEWIIGSWDVEPGDHFWKISEEMLTEAWGRAPSDAEIHDYWVDVVDANREHLISPGDDPNLIYPDQRFEVLLPPLPAEVTSPDDAASTTTPMPLDGLDQFTPVSPQPLGAPTGPTPEPAAEEPVDAPVESAPPVVQTPAPVAEPVAEEPIVAAPVAAAGGFDVRLIGLGLFGTAIGAGALLCTLRRRRSLQAARRRPDTEIEETPILPSEFEARIRPIADTEAVRWLNATNQFLTHRLAIHPEAKLPAVIAMRAGAHGVEILLDEASAPVEGFIDGGAAGMAWRLHPDLEPRMIEAEAGHAHHYCPAMLPIGETDAGDLLLDLEQIGAISVDGDAERVTGWLRSLAVGVTSVVWSQQCEVVAIGLGDDIGKIQQVTVPPNPQAWAKQVAAEAAATAHAMTASTYEQRVKPGEIHYPKIVLIGPGFEGVAQFLNETAELAYSPLALVAAAPLTSETRVTMHGPLATVEPLGLDFEPVETSADAITLAVAALTATENTVTIPRTIFEEPANDTASGTVETLIEPAVDTPPTPTELAATETPAEPGPVEPVGPWLDQGAEPSPADLYGTVSGEELIINTETVQDDAFGDAHDEPPAWFPATNTSADAEAFIGPIKPQPLAADLESEPVEETIDLTETQQPEPANLQDNRDDDDGDDDDPRPPEGPGGGQEHSDASNLEADTQVETAVSVGSGSVKVGASASVAVEIDEVLAPRPIEVRVLCDKPEIDGISSAGSKLESVIVYMAFFRTVSFDRLRSVFWPSSVSRSTADNALTQVRKLLGSNEAGESRLGLARQSGRFDVDEEVGSDWYRAETLVAMARTTVAEGDEMACLEAALGLVSGRPASEAPAKNYGWLRDDHEVYTRVETMLVDAAYRLGKLAYGAGDARLARWAADKGLEVVPGQEALHRIQMEAASLVGDQQGVEDAYRAAQRAAEALSAWEEVQPETDELYAMLTRREPGSQPVPGASDAGSSK